jgi:hypothetical protein
MPPAQRKDDILHAEIPSTLPLMALRSTIVYPLGTIAVQMGAPENLALLKANELQSKASHREQQLILARMQEKGLAPNVGNQDARLKTATLTLDNMLALYDDDEEA